MVLDGGMPKKRQLLVFSLAIAALICAHLQLLSDYGLNASGHVALAMVAVAALLWISEMLPLFVTSILVLIMAQVWLYPTMIKEGADVAPFTFYRAFVGDVIFLFLGSFSLSIAFRAFNLDRWLVNKAIGGRAMHFRWLMLSVMGVTTLLSFWLSNSAATALMLGLVMPIVASFPARDAGRKALILGIPFAANVGGLGTPISSPPNAIAMEYMRQHGFEPGFLKWVIIAMPGVFALLFVAWILLLLLFPSKQTYTQIDVEEVELKSGWNIPVLVAITIITIAGWISSPWLGLTPGTVAMFPVVTLFGLRILQKRHLRDFSWDVLLLMGGGLCLGVAAKESGLANWLIQLLPIHTMSFDTLLLALTVGSVLISSVMSNTAAANLILPVVVLLNVPNPDLLTLAVTFIASMSIPLPISTPPNALAFSTGEISAHEMAKAGTLMTLISVVLTLTLGFYYWRLLERLLQ